MIPGTGQKSGFYCDRREIRTTMERYAKDAVALDLGSYTGAFALHALRGGAKSVDLVDSSASALEQATAHIAINEEEGIIPKGSGERATTTVADMFEHLRAIENDHYNLIIIDPPKLASTKAQTDGAPRTRTSAASPWKIRHNGIIVSLSSSSNVTAEMLRLVLAFAATDARRDQILHNSARRPSIRLSFGESAYLNGFLIRVLRFWRAVAGEKGIEHTGRINRSSMKRPDATLAERPPWHRRRRAGGWRGVEVAPWSLFTQTRPGPAHMEHHRYAAPPSPKGRMGRVWWKISALPRRPCAGAAIETAGGRPPSLAITA